jgi:hypothetical protein
LTFNLSSIVSALTSAGTLTGTALTNTVSAILSFGANSKVKAALTTIMANSSNPKIVADEVDKIAEMNPPTAVANLLPSLLAATTPMQVIQAVQAIEAVL